MLSKSYIKTKSASIQFSKCVMKFIFYSMGKTKYFDIQNNSNLVQFF